ncbi:hypothetical protein [Pseudomonas zhanjiangensis]|uniref:Thioesterase-like superfamily protein n=1 Tax=Pseudomonas zhanjiangensis TaxID=3239015 RepID=A0ABV3YPW5_9PSED
MQLETLSIPTRFCGPPLSGNGGYVCGRIARHIDGCAAVRLLDRELSLEVGEHGTLRLMSGAVLVAEGRAAQLNLAVPAAPSLDEARQAAQHYLGFRHHSFPRCFVCGPLRHEGDGLRIFPGRLPGRSQVAAPWLVDPSLASDGQVPTEFLWAALDCPGAFAFLPIEAGMALVLGQLTVRIDGSVRPAEPCLVMAWPLGIEGRKHLAGSALFSVSGQLIALAQATWIAVPERTFQG